MTVRDWDYWIKMAESQVHSVSMDTGLRLNSKKIKTQSSMDAMCVIPQNKEVFQ